MTRVASQTGKVEAAFKACGATDVARNGIIAVSKEGPFISEG